MWRLGNWGLQVGDVVWLIPADFRHCPSVNHDRGTSSSCHLAAPPSPFSGRPHRLPPNRRVFLILLRISGMVWRLKTKREVIKHDPTFPVAGGQLAGIHTIGVFGTTGHRLTSPQNEVFATEPFDSCCILIPYCENKRLTAIQARILLRVHLGWPWAGHGDVPGAVLYIGE